MNDLIDHGYLCKVQKKMMMNGVFPEGVYRKAYLEAHHTFYLQQCQRLRLHQ